MYYLSMTWLLFALVAPLFWAISNFIDKYSLDKKTKGAYDFVFFSTLFSWLAIPILLLIFDFPSLTTYSVVPIISGFVLIYSFIFYARALEKNDASDIVVFLKVIPAIVLLFGYLFLDQVLSFSQLSGFLLVLLGAVIFSFDSKLSLKIKNIKPVLIMVLMWSSVFLISDYGLSRVSFWDYIIFEAIGSALAGLTLFISSKTRKEVIGGILSATPYKYFLFFINGIVDLLGQITIKNALLLAPSAALVTVVVQVQSVYAIAIGISLTFLLPNIIKENVSKEALIKKIFSACIMFLGIYLLFNV